MNPKILTLLSTLLVVVRSHPTNPPNPNRDRIVGGQPADISDVPFLVSVLYNGHLKCTGSLVSSRWILTSADCIALGYRYTVRVNSSDVNQGGTVVGTQSIVVHPRYSLHDRDYNFALLEVEQDLGVQAADLPEFDELPEYGAALDAFGWHKDWWDWDYELRKGSLPVVEREKCQYQIWEEFSITDRMICAGNYKPDGADNLSHGNEGSPLVDGNKLIGVASLDYSSGGRIYPAIFGRVSSVLCWIHATIEKDVV